jgi:hypothetical protein
VVGVLVTAGASAAPASSVGDVERDATAPTSWHYWVGKSKAEIDRLARAAGDRVVNIQVRALSPGPRFNAVTVKNTGPYGRVGGWSYGSEASVTAKIKAERGRLIDIEPYTVDGRRAFAYVWVKNEGAAAKEWYWGYDMTLDQVAAAISRQRIRLIDLESYVVAGKRRYAYVGIVNRGADTTAWWWYVNVTPAFVERKARQNRARIIDIDRPAAGRVSVVMQRNAEGAYARHVYDYTLDDLMRFQASNGVRIVDVEEYRKNGKLRYTATLIDNATDENRRIRSIWRASTMAQAPNSTDAFFGVYAKQVGGPVHVNLAENMTYNPLSVLKLLPHLYVMDRLDADPGGDLLDEPRTVTWKALKGKPGEPYCPERDEGKASQTNTTTLRTTLWLALNRSWNPAHEALLNKYGWAAINRWAHAKGMRDTNVYPGCPQPNGGRDWRSNTSTLADFGRLFEGVDNKTFFPRNWAKVSAEFYGLIANWGQSGIRDVVDDEAKRVGKQRIVDRFMSMVTLDGKGGGTIIGQSDGSFHGGRGYFFRLGLPFATRPGNATTQRTFVGGYFVDNFSAPCNEDKVKESTNPSCSDWKKKQDAAYRLLLGEPFRTAIRNALATWPNS